MNEIQSMKQRHSLKTPYTSDTPETRDMRGNVWAWGLLNVDIFMVGHTGTLNCRLGDYFALLVYKSFI